MKKSFTRPRKGESFSVAKLKKDSKEWDLKSWKDYGKFLLEEKITDQNLWEIYLRKLEVPLRESYINPKRYINLSMRPKDDLSKEEKEEQKELKKFIKDGDVVLEEELGGECERSRDKGGRSYYSKYKKYIPMALRILTYRERKVIEGIFWDGKTERNLGRDFNLNKKTISVFKNRAFEKIKDYLLNAESEQQKLNMRKAA